MIRRQMCVGGERSPICKRNVVIGCVLQHRGIGLPTFRTVRRKQIKASIDRSLHRSFLFEQQTIRLVFSRSQITVQHRFCNISFNHAVPTVLCKQLQIFGS